jgi:hypothetical protein
MPDQPAVCGIRGQEPEDHPDLHKKPVRGVIRRQMRLGEQDKEEQRHPAEQADLERDHRERV